MTGGLLTQVNCGEKCAVAVLNEAVSKVVFRTGSRWSLKTGDLLTQVH